METDFDTVQKNARNVADVLKVLAHETRLRVICCIGDGEQTVLDMAELLSVGQSCLSQHLAKMRNTGILEVRKDGNQCFYKVKDRRIMKVVEAMKDSLC